MIMVRNIFIKTFLDIDPHNYEENNSITIAKRDINKGEELFINYSNSSPRYY